MIPAAVMLDRAHLDALICAALSSPPGTPARFTYDHDGGTFTVDGSDPAGCYDTGTPDELGDYLARVNYAAVDWLHRAYGGPDAGDYPAPRHYQAPRWPLGPVAILKALDTYEANASPARLWSGSHAQAFTAALRLWVIRQLPGYDAAPATITVTTRDPAAVAGSGNER